MVKDVLGETIHTREASHALLSLVSENACDNIELDFTGVKYISRSFADQFHSDKIELATKKPLIIIVTNAGEEVISMLQAVARTQSKFYREHASLPVYRYSTWDQLENFLLSL